MLRSLRIPSRPVTGLAASALVAALLSAGGSGKTPLVLLNDSPSEPTGLYLLTRKRIESGRLVAFHTPSEAFPYADHHHPMLRRHPILKEVAASSGDEVCTTSNRLVINATYRARIANEDRFGETLPHWRQCRRLSRDELFVFSNRIPQSFDSRYYGPIRQSQVIGVYQLILPLSLGAS